MLDKVREYYQNNRRRMNILIIAAVGLGVFSYAALQFSSQPSFCNSCHEMNPAFDNWKTSVHAEVTCNACHIEPGFTNLILHKMKSYKEIIAHLTVYNKPNAPKIHAKEKEPVNEACGQCHSFNREMAFGGGMNVPHKLHIDKGLTCPTCHSRVVHGDPDQRKPKMETCMTCHETGKEGAPKLKCKDCHTKFSIPENHTKPNWLQVHGATSTKPMSKSMNCKNCHNWRPDWCMQCHKQKPESHLTRWRANHGAHAATDRKGCNACHTADFCMRCHGIQP